ncbi:PTS mannose/fructose/sorbose/N-acetylgalactosamine transporter subunit IIC [Lacrimispora xylanolytica]|uniref:PTS sugar transporter subunit IIC n=1 Tax=Lacrimispora xylanolytica TaxID=29375 RepID=A0ABY7ABV2_9FIRM|nr:PTS sugar transporter subunit IIC [Lacrimispora xylanolytica]MBS5955728.1 PTS sugar transporter subunit IIC [Clostridiales bacterium]WAJ23001.1 PTS sugar transporter subunit IIC [Lacrimispora xylanolytica]
MSVITVALIGTLTYWIFFVLDPYILSWQCLNRPIVVAPILGLLLGDFQTGIIMGASLESIFMGISAIGGSVPADALSASIVAVCYTVLTGSDVETGLAIALPIGTVMASLSSILLSFSSALAPYWEKLALSGKPGRFLTQNLIFSGLIYPLPNVIIIFLGIAFGVTGLNSALAALPPFVMTGLTAASSMMVAVGFAILISMIWSKDVASFFFVGYVMAKILKMDSLSIAIIGGAIAITMFFYEKQLIDVKNSMVASEQRPSDDEEDFF